MEKTIETNTVATKSNVVQALRLEAKQNPVFDAITTVFALRERARSQVTVRALQQRMQAEGYELEKEQIEHALKFLANLRIGTLVTGRPYDGRPGRVKALVNIKYTLQSVGKAAQGETGGISSFNKRASFIALPTRPVKTPPPVVRPAPKVVKVASKPAVMVQKEALARHVKAAAVLTATFDGEKLELPLTGSQFKSFILGLLGKKN